MVHVRALALDDRERWAKAPDRARTGRESKQLLTISIREGPRWVDILSDCAIIFIHPAARKLVCIGGGMHPGGLVLSSAAPREGRALEPAAAMRTPE